MAATPRPRIRGRKEIDNDGSRVSPIKKLISDAKQRRKPECPGGIYTSENQKTIIVGERNCSTAVVRFFGWLRKSELRLAHQTTEKSAG